MLIRPSKKYQVYDSTNTDDLVFWTPLDQPSDYIRDQGLRQRVTECLPQAACFAGPINSQHACDPLGDEPVILPVHYHFWLDTQKQCTFFLFLTKTTIELHLPELWFVTGSSDEDEHRLKRVRNLIANLSQTFGIKWKLVEYSGTKFELRDNNDFWETYISDLFARIDYEEIDDEETA